MTEHDVYTLPLAIALYEDAVNSSTAPRPDLVFRLAELHERIGEPAKAVVFLTRYLELSPSAADARHVRERIARLAPPKELKGVAVAPLVATPPKPKTPPMKCYCYPDHGSGRTHFKLCRALSKAAVCLLRKDLREVAPAVLEARHRLQHAVERVLRRISL